MPLTQNLFINPFDWTAFVFKSSFCFPLYVVHVIVVFFSSRARLQLHVFFQYVKWYRRMHACIFMCKTAVCKFLLPIVKVSFNDLVTKSMHCIAFDEHNTVKWSNLELKFILVIFFTFFLLSPFCVRMSIQIVWWFEIYIGIRMMWKSYKLHEFVIFVFVLLFMCFYCSRVHSYLLFLVFFLYVCNEDDFICMYIFVAFAVEYLL